MRVAAVLASLLFVACQAVTPRYQPPNGVGAQLTLSAATDFDTVWRAVIETFAETTTPIETIEKASGFVAAAKAVDFSSMKDLPSIVDFGVLDGAWASTVIEARPSRSSARLRYNVFVAPTGERHTVRVNATWAGHSEVQGTVAGGGPVMYRVDLTGNSTGWFERRVLEAIAAKLPTADPKVEVAQEFKASKFNPEPRKFGQESENDGWVQHGTGH